MTILEEAAQAVRGARIENYNHPLDNFGQIAGMWTVILGTEVTASQVALCMIALKIMRENFSHTHDNLVDIAGYAYCIDLMREERERRASTETPRD